MKPNPFKLTITILVVITLALLTARVIANITDAYVVATPAIVNVGDPITFNASGLVSTADQFVTLYICNSSDCNNCDASNSEGCYCRQLVGRNTSNGSITCPVLGVYNSWPTGSISFWYMFKNVSSPDQYTTPVQGDNTFVVNHRPTATNVHIDGVNSAVLDNATLNCSYTFSDPDGNSENYTQAQFTWYRNTTAVQDILYGGGIIQPSGPGRLWQVDEVTGSFEIIAGQTTRFLSPSYFNLRDFIYCVVNVSDAYGFPDVTNETSTVVQVWGNYPPSIIDVQDASDNDSSRIKVGSNITFRLNWSDLNTAVEGENIKFFVCTNNTATGGANYTGCKATERTLCSGGYTSTNPATCSYTVQQIDGLFNSSGHALPQNYTLTVCDDNDNCTSSINYLFYINHKPYFNSTLLLVNDNNTGNYLYSPNVTDSSNLICNLTRSQISENDTFDLESGNLTIKYWWIVNRSNVITTYDAPNDAVLTHGNTIPGEYWRCNATPFDGSLWGDTFTSDWVYITDNYGEGSPRILNFTYSAKPDGKWLVGTRLNFTIYWESTIYSPLLNIYICNSSAINRTGCNNYVINETRNYTSGSPVTVSYTIKEHDNNTVPFWIMLCDHSGGAGGDWRCSNFVTTSPYRRYNSSEVNGWMGNFSVDHGTAITKTTIYNNTNSDRWGVDYTDNDNLYCNATYTDIDHTRYDANYNLTRHIVVENGSVIYAGTTLSSDTNASDYVTFTYRWYTNRTGTWQLYNTADSPVLAHPNTQIGDWWICEATPYDTYYYGPAVNSTAINITSGDPGFPSIISMTDTSNLVNRTNVGDYVNFSVTWTDTDSSQVKLYICADNNINESGCLNTTVYYHGNFSTQNPIFAQYKVNYSDANSTPYYARICDNTGGPAGEWKCSNIFDAGTGVSGVFTPNHLPNITYLEYTTDKLNADGTYNFTDDANLICNVTVNDVDSVSGLSDWVSLIVTWFRKAPGEGSYSPYYTFTYNPRNVTNTTLLNLTHGNTRVGDFWYCAVRATDSYSYSAYVNSTPQEIVYIRPGELKTSITNITINSFANYPVNVGSTVRFNVSWTDRDSTQVKLYICKDPNIQMSGCMGEPIYTGSYTTANPVLADYTAAFADNANQTWYAMLCDNSNIEGNCSEIYSYQNYGNVYVNHAPMAYNVMVLSTPEPLLYCSFDNTTMCSDSIPLDSRSDFMLGHKGNAGNFSYSSGTKLNATNNINVSSGTVEFWVQELSNFAAYSNPVLFAFNSTNKDIVIRMNETINFTVSNSTHNNSCTYFANFTTGTWHHIAMTWQDAADLSAYIDGVRVCNITNSNVRAPIASTGVITIGYAEDSAAKPNVSIDEFYIYASPKNQHEIYDDYMHDKPVAKDTLLCSYMYNMTNETQRNDTTGITGDVDSNNTLYRWYVQYNRTGSFTLISGQAGKYLSNNISAIFTRRDTVKCSALVTDTRGLPDYTYRESAELNISNARPAINISISPSYPTDSDNLYCSYSIAEYDREAYNVTFKWYKNEVFHEPSNNTQTLLHSWTSDQENWTCEIEVNDSVSITTKRSLNVTIGSTAANTTSATPTINWTSANLTNQSANATINQGDLATIYVSWLDADQARFNASRSEQGRIFVCNSSRITRYGCLDTMYCYTNFSSDYIANCSFNTTAIENLTTVKVYSLVCDDTYNCSNVSDASFTINHRPTALSVSVLALRNNGAWYSVQNLDYGNHLNTFNATWKYWDQNSNANYTDNETIVIDANNNSRFDREDSDFGYALTNFSSFEKYVDTSGDSQYDRGETVVYDTNLDSFYTIGDRIINGSGPTPVIGTSLRAFTNAKYRNILSPDTPSYDCISECERIYTDPDTSGNVTAGDIRLLSYEYAQDSVVLGREVIILGSLPSHSQALRAFVPTDKYFDTNGNLTFDSQDYVYSDYNNNSIVDENDYRRSLYDGYTQDSLVTSNANSLSNLTCNYTFYDRDSTPENASLVNVMWYVINSTDNVTYPYSFSHLDLYNNISGVNRSVFDLDRKFKLNDQVYCNVTVTDLYGAVSYSYNSSRIIIGNSPVLINATMDPSVAAAGENITISLNYSFDADNDSVRFALDCDLYDSITWNYQLSHNLSYRCSYNDTEQKIITVEAYDNKTYSMHNFTVNYYDNEPNATLVTPVAGNYYHIDDLLNITYNVSGKTAYQKSGWLYYYNGSSWGFIDASGLMANGSVNSTYWNISSLTAGSDYLIKVVPHDQYNKTGGSDIMGSPFSIGRCEYSQITNLTVNNVTYCRNKNNITVNDTIIVAGNGTLLLYNVTVNYSSLIVLQAGARAILNNSFMHRILILSNASNLTIANLAPALFLNTSSTAGAINISLHDSNFSSLDYTLINSFDTVTNTQLRNFTIYLTGVSAKNLTISSSSSITGAFNATFRNVTAENVIMQVSTSGNNYIYNSSVNRTVLSGKCFLNASNASVVNYLQATANSNCTVFGLVNLTGTDIILDDNATLTRYFAFKVNSTYSDLVGQTVTVSYNGTTVATAVTGSDGRAYVPVQYWNISNTSNIPYQYNYSALNASGAFSIGMGFEIVITQNYNCTDSDSDGYYLYNATACSIGNDCDDANAARHPGATDIPDNGIDEDCSGADATAGSNPGTGSGGGGSYYYSGSNNSGSTNQGKKSGSYTSKATCYDLKQNQGETGIDCGGPCSSCPTCYDGVMNGGEIKIDCGGPCSACPSCYDGVQNGAERGVDCGGSCPACPVIATCSDKVKNQGEAGIDCGGPCSACPEVETPFNFGKIWYALIAFIIAVVVIGGAIVLLRFHPKELTPLATAPIPITTPLFLESKEDQLLAYIYSKLCLGFNEKDVKDVVAARGWSKAKTDEIFARAASLHSMMLISGLSMPSVSSTELVQGLKRMQSQKYSGEPYTQEQISAALACHNWDRNVVNDAMAQMKGSA